MKKFIALFFILLCSTAYAADITPYFMPEDGLTALQTFFQNTDDVLLATYTFDSPQTAAYLEKTAQNNKVIVIVDAAPAGGINEKEKATLCDMKKNNVDVRLYDGPLKFMHAKYAISGDKLLISTQNFEEGSYTTEKKGSRGWGVLITDEETAQSLRKIFYDDLESTTSIEKKFECTYAPIAKNTNYAAGSLKTHQGTAKLVVAPDNAIFSITAMMNATQQRLYIEQFYIYKKWGKQDNPLLEVALEKAREKTSVKILLDGSWYNIDANDGNDNDNTVKYANDAAKKENLDLEAKVVNLASHGYDLMHTKGVVTDNEALVSSINWNENSPTKNREIGVILSGPAVERYAQAFQYDWDDAASATTGKVASNQNILTGIMVIAAIILVFLFLRKK